MGLKRARQNWRDLAHKQQDKGSVQCDSPVWAAVHQSYLLLRETMDFWQVQDNRSRHWVYDHEIHLGHVSPNSETLKNSLLMMNEWSQFISMFHVGSLVTGMLWWLPTQGPELNEIYHVKVLVFLERSSHVIYLIDNQLNNLPKEVLWCYCTFCCSHN